MTEPHGAATVRWQVAKAAEEHHEGFDATALTLTLTMYRCFAAFERAGSVELAPHGLTTSQLNILTVLHRSERPLTMGELGQAVSVRPANLTGVVDALTRRSLIERQVNPEDRRSYLIANTAAGEDFLQRFLPGHWQHLRRLSAELTDDEQLMLVDLLERFRVSVLAVDNGLVPVPAAHS